MSIHYMADTQHEGWKELNDIVVWTWQLSVTFNLWTQTSAQDAKEVNPFQRS